MFRRVLNQIREHVRTREYVMTVHAEEEMGHDDFSIFDVEHALLVGLIQERQRDQTTGEWKYCVKGQALDRRDMQITGKISVTGKLVIITVFDLSGGRHDM